MKKDKQINLSSGELGFILTIQKGSFLNIHLTFQILVKCWQYIELRISEKKKSKLENLLFFFLQHFIPTSSKWMHFEETWVVLATAKYCDLDQLFLLLYQCFIVAPTKWELCINYFHGTYKHCTKCIKSSMGIWKKNGEGCSMWWDS